jgi:hypothetical protein
MVKTAYLRVLLQLAEVVAVLAEFLGLLVAHQAVAAIVAEHLQRQVLRVKEILEAAVVGVLNLVVVGVVELEAQV